ncbi:MAG: hypothetical protein KC587_17530 [Nitrospira sp.]|nr:hypothetical protein [Nitrospira sp.]
MYPRCHHLIVKHVVQPGNSTQPGKGETGEHRAGQPAGKAGQSFFRLSAKPTVCHAKIIQHSQQARFAILWCV